MQVPTGDRVEIACIQSGDDVPRDGRKGNDFERDHGRVGEHEQRPSAHVGRAGTDAGVRDASSPPARDSDDVSSA